jgi:hypothetical protein
MISSLAIGQDFITKDFIVPTKPKTHKVIPPSEWGDPTFNVKSAK